MKIEAFEGRPFDSSQSDKLHYSHCHSPGPKYEVMITGISRTKTNTLHSWKLPRRQQEHAFQKQEEGKNRNYVVPILRSQSGACMNKTQITKFSLTRLSKPWQLALSIRALCMSSSLWNQDFCTQIFSYFVHTFSITSWSDLLFLTLRWCKHIPTKWSGTTTRFHNQVTSQALSRIYTS